MDCKQAYGLINREAGYTKKLFAVTKKYMYMKKMLCERIEWKTSNAFNVNSGLTQWDSVFSLL